MDKRKQRSQKKQDHIKKIALELFSTYGFDKVSMDEIAEKAGVSKVTIYKYFGSKDDLYAEVISIFIDETLSASEAALNSDMPFLDKLKFMLTTQAESSSLVSFDTLYQVWENDDTAQKIQERVMNLMHQFYEEGRSKGLIHEHVTFETVMQYSEIFRAGIKATFLDKHLPLDKQVLDALYDVYFFGIIKRK